MLTIGISGNRMCGSSNRLTRAGDIPWSIIRRRAVVHAGNQEKAVEIVQVDALRYECLRYLIVEVDAASGGDEGVCCPVVHQNLGSTVQ